MTMSPIAHAQQTEHTDAVALVQPNSPVAISPRKSDTSPVNAVSAWLEANAAPDDSERKQQSITPPISSDHAASSDSKVVRRRAAREPAVAQARGSADGVGISGSPQILWPLMAVLGTIGVMAMLVRRWMSGGTRLNGESGIRVLARHFLSNKQSLCLVRVGRRVVLLGVTPERISACADIDDPEEVSNLIAAAQRGGAGSFTAALAGFSKSDVAEEAVAPKAAAEGSETVLPGRGAATGASIRQLLDRLQALSDEPNRAERA